MFKIIDTLLIISCAISTYLYVVSEIHSVMENQSFRKFPDDFIFGVSTSAYQIEGAWNLDGATESIWDVMSHTKGAILDNTTGDIACDSYHKYQRDVQMLKELNVQFYRFSISWNRLLPNGTADYVNDRGLLYYNNLINELISNNITPMVTLYHFDLPQKLQDEGGWVNPAMADRFLDYARVAFEKFGDRVKYWITFNEPARFCQYGYGDDIDAPRVNKSGIADYKAGHTVLRAHAKVYHHYKGKYEGKIAMCINGLWIHPENGTFKEQEYTDKYMQFETGWFAHPLFFGNYPKVMMDSIDDDRLPKFTEDEMIALKGSYDFLGINYYTTFVGTLTERNVFPIPSYQNDVGLHIYQLESWLRGKSKWMRNVPWGFKNYLEWIKNQYDNPQIIVFENGFSSDEDIEDVNRIIYIKEHLNALLDAIQNKSNIIGYAVWSLMDNFEWSSGLSERFGLYRVDFDDPDRTRTQRKSAKMYNEIITSKQIDRIYIPDVHPDQPPLK